MGEPAVPTGAERAAALAYANIVLEAERNDEDPPHPRFEDGAAMPDDVLIFRLSQDLVDNRAALEAACAALQGNYTTTERDELAKRLLKLDLTPLEVDP